MLDCANGAAYKIAPQIFSKLGGKVVKINCQSSGKKINEKCGSTCIGGLKEKVVKESFAAGVKSELSKVKWPTKHEVIKYTIATLVFIVVLVLFFVLLSLLMSVIKGAFN